MSGLTVPARATDTGTITPSLAKEAYIDRNTYHRELDEIFARTWQYVCHVENVRDAGDYIVCEVAGESLIVLRGADGNLKGYFNVCAHRGARIVSGNGCRQRLTCPYHGWTYDTDGRLVGAPNGMDVPGFRQTDYGLKSVSVEEIHGLVFVNLDPDAATLRSLVPGLEHQLKSFSPELPDLTFAHRTEADLATNWKIAVENYSECYHCALVHKSFFGQDGVDAKSYRVSLKGQWHLHLADAESQEADREHANEFAAWWIWPNFAIQSHPGCVLNVRQWRPNAVDSTYVYVDWFFPEANLKQDDKAMVEHHAATVFAEDIPLVESVQQGMSSRAYSPGPLMIDENRSELSEHAVADIQRLWREAMGVS